LWLSHFTSNSAVAHEQVLAKHQAINCDTGFSINAAYFSPPRGRVAPLARSTLDPEWHEGCRGPARSRAKAIDAARVRKKTKEFFFQIGVSEFVKNF
jgi:hypothetical protein